MSEKQTKGKTIIMGNIARLNELQKSHDRLAEALEGMLDEFGVEHYKKNEINRRCNRCLLLINANEALRLKEKESLK